MREGIWVEWEKVEKVYEYNERRYMSIMREGME